MSDLLVRLPNWVGDACLTVPTLHGLRSAGFRLHFVGRPWARDLLAGFDRPVLPVGKGVIRPARVLRSTRIRDGLLITESLGTAGSFRLAGVRAIGFSGEKGRRPLLFRAMDRPRRVPAMAAYWELAKLAHETFRPEGSWPERAPSRPYLPLTETHHAQAEAALQQSGVEEPFTLVCPLTVGVRGGNRVWPHWREASRRLSQDGRLLVTCPGPGEETACAAAVPDAAALPGLRLGAYAAVCARAEQVLSNLTGPAHLAAAVGTDVLCIYHSIWTWSGPWRGEILDVDDGWPTVDDLIERLRPRPMGDARRTDPTRLQRLE